MNIKNKKLFFGLFTSYILLILVLCAVGAIPAGSNTWEQGAAIYFPYENKVVGNEFNIIGSAYSKEDIESVELKIEPDGIIIPVEMEKIYYEGEEILTLSSFVTSVSLDGYGDFSAKVIITDSTGMYEYDEVAFKISKINTTASFEMFSIQHLLALMAVLIVYLILLFIYKKYPKNKTKNFIYGFITLGIVFCDFAVKIWLIKNGAFKISYDGFLHMCDLSGPFLIILFYMKDSKNRQRFFSLMFIWGVLGAAMALLTPEMRGNVFPSLYFMTFFIKHGVIVIGVLLVGVIEKYSPKLKHLPIVMAASIVIVAIVYAIDRLIVFIPPYEPGNYMFLSYPPTSGSAIDILVKIFGPSPYYIIGMVLLALILYTIMWAIYAIIGKMRSNK